MNFTLAWDPYPDQTWDGWRIYYNASLTPSDWVLLTTVNSIAETSKALVAPQFGAFNYSITAFKGSLESPRSSTVQVEFQIQAPTGLRRIA